MLPFSNIKLECNFSFCSVSLSLGHLGSNDLVFSILEIQTWKGNFGYRTAHKSKNKKYNKQGVKISFFSLFESWFIILTVAENPPVQNLTVTTAVAKVSGLASFQNYTITISALTRAGPGIRWAHWFVYYLDGVRREGGRETDGALYCGVWQTMFM